MNIKKDFAFVNNRRKKQFIDNVIFITFTSLISITIFITAFAIAIIRS